MSPWRPGFDPRLNRWIFGGENGCETNCLPNNLLSLFQAYSAITSYRYVIYLPCMIYNVRNQQRPLYKYFCLFPSVSRTSNFLAFIILTRQAPAHVCFFPHTLQFIIHVYLSPSVLYCVSYGSEKFVGRNQKLPSIW